MAATRGSSLRSTRPALEAPKPGKRKSGKGGRKGCLEGHGGRGKGAAEAAEDTPESPFELPVLLADCAEVRTP